MSAPHSQNVVVPVEPTLEMRQAAVREIDRVVRSGGAWSYEMIYRAMVAAAPHSGPEGEDLKHVLMIVNMLLEDVAKDPSRLLRAQEIAKRDITAAPQSAGAERDAVLEEAEDAMLGVFADMDRVYLFTSGFDSRIIEARDAIRALKSAPKSSATEGRS